MQPDNTFYMYLDTIKTTSVIDGIKYIFIKLTPILESIIGFREKYVDSRNPPPRYDTLLTPYTLYAFKIWLYTGHVMSFYSRVIANFTFRLIRTYLITYTETMATLHCYVFIWYLKGFGRRTYLRVSYFAKLLYDSLSFLSASLANISQQKTSTVKPVCNDHLYNKICYLWFIQ